MPGRSAALILALCLAAQTLRAAEDLGAWVWRDDRQHFGGFSAIEVGANGRDFIAVSDRAGIVEGTFRRNAAGRIIGLDAGPLVRVKDVRGGHLPQNLLGDSEGIAGAPGGPIWVSFEGRARVMRYETPGASAQPLPRPAAFRQMGSNGSLEALAMDQAGRLLTLPENVTEGENFFPVYRYDGRTWTQPFNLGERGGFAAVGLDVDDQGRLYLLERKFVGIGFRTRVRRFTLDGDEVASEETLFASGLRHHDNLEGIAVWRDAAASLRLTMISDDNFNSFQRTEIVEYSVPD